MFDQASKEYSIAPAFRHEWQLWTFLLFILLFSLLPVVPKPAWIDRSTLYLAFDDAQKGRSIYFANNVLQESEDIDILFLGHSSIEADINPLIIKKALRPVLGREPVVYALGHRGDALDYDYIALRDILSKRKVHLLIWHRNKISDGKEGYKFAQYLWDFYLHKTALDRLPIDQKISIYFFNVMNGLRLVLSPFKDRLPPLHTETCLHSDIYFGACMRCLERTNLAAAMPAPPSLMTDKLIHRRRAEDSVLVEKGQYTPYDRIFSDAVFDLAAKQGTAVALMQVPYSIGATPADKIIIPAMEPDQPGNNAFILGGAVTDLFPGKTIPEIVQTFYMDEPPKHFHYAGADYFTHAMLPGIIAVFQQTLNAKPVQP